MAKMAKTNLKDMEPKVLTEHIFIPIFISDAVRSAMIPQIEAKILGDIKLTNAYSLIDQSDTEFKSEAQPIIVNRGAKNEKTLRIKTVYAVIKGASLVNLLSYDIKKFSSKVSQFFNRINDLVYRKVFAPKLASKTAFDDIWKNKYSFVVFDKSDIDKAGLNVPLEKSLILKLQNNGWPNIAIFSQEEGGLYFYYVKNKGYGQLSRF